MRKATVLQAALSVGLGGIGLGAERGMAAGLSPAEQAEVDQRLTDFYRQPMDPSLMNRHVPKYDATSGDLTWPNPELRLKGAPPLDPLSASAEAKGTRSFHKAECDGWQHHFTRSPCAKRVWSTVEDDDRYEDLVDGWVTADAVAPDLTTAPARGKVATVPWTDDYWRTQWGGISYRYSAGKQYTDYHKAVAAYAQPDEWTKLSDSGDHVIERTVADWSPAEKYDLVVGDDDFHITAEQKAEGLDQLDGHDNVPSWMGLCDGWATAGVMTPRPSKPVDAAGPSGINVHWYPSDVRAITTLAWARGDFATNFVGGRCEEKHPELYPNGRIKNQDCFDTNPATYHMALANMLGVAHKAFIIDASYDAEVWNQPLVSYNFVYFNPLDTTKRSDDWTQVAVPYDAAFKAADRFQKPLTRGVRDGDDYDDSAVERVVGVIATIVYMDDATPTATDDAPEDTTVRATYTYDLELSTVDGKLVPTGGEWHENTHPDFLWVPRPGTVARAGKDDGSIGFDPATAPDSDRTDGAVKVGSGGAPLCSVVAGLVESSSGGTYPDCTSK